MKTAINFEPVFIYSKTSMYKQEGVFSGITFADFVECTTISINNILLIKSDCVLEKQYRNFEVLEGKNNITKFAHEGMHKHGDFCFVDYADSKALVNLTEEQIAELLYFGHQSRPLKSPFFEILQNSFAYYSHDDGWYCKLYCREQQTFNLIVLNKIKKTICSALPKEKIALPNSLPDEISKLIARGLLVEVKFLTLQEQALHSGDRVVIRLYEVGEFDNIDILFNNLENNKPQVLFEVFASV